MGSILGVTMPCTHPTPVWISEHLKPNGKMNVSFKPVKDWIPGSVPCGKCYICRLERSRQWAMRCVHEAQTYNDKNAFITLTYNDESLPPGANLDLRDWQLFMKNLRKRLVPKNPYDRQTDKEEFDKWQLANGIRFFMCAEYGENAVNNPEAKPEDRQKHLQQYGYSKLGRPHFHAIIFNQDFRFIHEDTKLPDLELERKSPKGDPLYRSRILEECWGKGFVTVGDVTFESAAYCARYVMKKMTGEMSEQHYTRMYEDGELIKLKPEFTCMSKRPVGIGQQWFDKYKTDVYPKDFTTIRGKKLKPPKYYDRLLETIDSELLESIKDNRREFAELNNDDDGRYRLRHKEMVKKAQTQNLNRNLDREI